MSERGMFDAIALSRGLITFGIAIVLSGCALQQRIQQQRFQAMQNTCASYGAGPGSPAYTSCMLQIRQQQIEQANAFLARQQAQQRMQQQALDDTLRAITRPVEHTTPHSFTCMQMGAGMTSCSGY